MRLISFRRFRKHCKHRFSAGFCLFHKNGTCSEEKCPVLQKCEQFMPDPWWWQ